MIRKDVIVKRPEGTKIYRQRNCEYVYHVTGSEYKKDKQYVVEKRVCIGKMVDDENMNPRVMKIKDNYISYILLFLAGVLAGIICRLSDFFPYESLWSLSSIATMFGFWIASVGLITCFSSSNRGAFINSFLYMFGMTLSFYGLKSILGLYIERFSSESHFQTNLFLLYSALSVVCGIGSYILYYWNNGKLIGSIFCALPASGMLAEAVACLLMLLNHRMLLAQTLFDFVFAVIFLFLLYKKANYKTIYFATMGVVTILVFLVVYQPFLF